MTLKRWGLASLSKRNLILLLSVSLALTGTLWALLATPYDGPWTGTNSAGRAVSFTVSGGGTAWTAFSYGISFSCSLGGTVTTTITQSGPGAITDGEFSYSSSTLAFTGSFDSPTSASGTYTLTAYPVTHGLGFPPYVHTDYITLSGTWTAAFSGSLNSLDLTAPNGGETWAAGSTHNITWTSLGEIENVTLEYSANGGTDWTTIVETTPNSGSYPWTLPGSPSATVLVRVSDAAAPTIFDTSAAVFSIVQAIPASQRQALIALYNATTGDSWSDNHGWKTPPLALDGFAMPGTEETWAGVTVDIANSTVTQLNLIYHNLSGSIPSAIGNLEGLQYLDLSGNSLTGSIPTEMGGLTQLSYLGLYSNQLSGAIPGELGDLADLQTLMLFQNQLSGPIPAELGGLTSLSILHLGDNQLSGAIPSALSGLVTAQQVILSSNRLTGPIPAELGGMTGLMYLYLNGNQLSGSIPTALTGMVSMEPGGLNIGYNALYAADPALVSFLNTKNPGWASTQTITPTEITATALDGARILVSWLPIAYSADAGSYRIFSSLDPGGPYSAAGQTADKSASAAEVSGLTPGETYYFVVRAHTDAHANNPSAVESEDSSEASAVAWTRINPRIAGVVRVGSSPLPGVVMSGLVGNPVTDSNGAYDVTVAAGWTGTVTPTLAGYTFDPAFRAYSVLPDDQLDQDYAATQITFTISGTVTVGSTALAGVTMAGLPHSPVTDASGYYADAVPYGWSGTVTPTHSYYAFDPASLAYVNVTSDQIGRNYSASLITTPQRQALIALYNSTNGGSWYNNSGWKTEPLYPDGFALPGTEGTWFGLTVDTETLMVTEINLVGNGLTGSLPSALATLTQLQGLYIGNNYMSGPIPPELGTLTGLMNLQLYNDQLTGSIPPELGNLVNLRSLALNANQLTGQIPPELGSLSNLVQLRLNENQLSGSIPPELGSLTNLSVLGLFWNSLSGSIPPELANMTGLQILVLSHNQLTGTIPPGLGGLINLLTLGLDENHLSGTIPDELGSLADLMILGLSSNQLSGALPSGLGNLIHLSELHLNGNQLAGLIPASFVNLTALTPNALITDLGHNALYATDPDLITFLNSKDADWASRQTIAPADVTATSLDNAVIMVSWLPVTYTADAGYYQILMSDTLGGPYTPVGQTADKATSSLNVTSLTPGQRYYFVVRTVTNAHASNANIVESGNSAEASTVAWTQINVQITGTVLAGGLPLEGVVMSGLTGSPVTDALGVYTGTEAAGWGGTVTPTLAGYTFAPSFRAYSALTEDQLAQDYSATPLSYAISGSVTMGATGIAGVTMSGLPGNPVTDASGDYSGMVTAGWSGTVTPTHASYTFDPVSQLYTNVNANMSSQDYSASLITTPQRQALIAFYDSTNGDSWSNNSGWKTPPLYPDGFAMPGTEGTWYGLTVDSGTSNVTSIDLQMNNVAGTIPAALGNLTGLTFLNFYSNQLSGSIPPEMGALVNLQTLYLMSNHLSGQIPVSLGGLSHLQTLDLDTNELEGPIPAELGNLSTLQNLWLSSNNLSGSIPVSLSDLANLLSLDLSSNDLSGSIPPELGDLTSLGNLFLAANHLTGAIPAELGGLANLSYLSLGNNELSGSIPPELGNLSNLMSLFLGNNQLTGPIPTEFGGLGGLYDLFLQNNQLTGSFPVEMCSLPNLRLIRLESNQLNGSIPAEIGNLSSLGGLHLQSNQLSGQIPAALGSLSNLLALRLSANHLTGPVPSELGGLLRLQTLDLGSNQLAGPIPTTLTSLVNLNSSVTNLGYNALYTADGALITFLNSKDADWALRQTIAPTQVTATSLDNVVIMVSWLPVTYTADAGYYQILMSDTLGGPYTPVGQTADKATSSLNVTSLTPGQRYYFVVRTVTNAHANNANIVESGNSTEASAVAWTQINVQITGTILAGGLPLANVLLAGLPGTVVTNASGVYGASVAAGSSPTVTPTLEGYSFAPVSRAYTTVTEDQTAQDYTASEIVAPTITVVSPNGGEAWGIGSIYDVTWSSTGGITNVKLEYSVNGGADWATIIETISNSGSYHWTVPSPASGFCVIKVSDASDLGVTDLSDSVFSIIQAIPSSERQALIDLYNSTNGENWNSNSGWKTAPLYTDGFAMPGTEGTWFGVLVDSGRVITLDPYLNNLNGSLPASLGALTSLQTLNVSHNQLTGPIPASLGNLSSLRSLFMDFNSLSGAIPVEICNMENLREIWLSRNDLSGTIPAGLGALVDLQDIRLDYNDLSGSIPAELGNLPLDTLFLMDNELTGSIPAELGGLAHLVLLDLSLNQLSGEIPPELGNLTNLKWLILHRNQLSGSIPEELGGLAKLEVLNLLFNQLSGPLPAALGDLSSLQNLRITSNKIMGAIPTSFINLVGLTLTDLAYNALYTTDEALITFLNSKDPDWAVTQTIAPADVTATSLDNAVIMVSWLPVTYTADAGYYQILMSDTLGGPYTPVGQTADKATSSLNVTSLTPGQRYYFVVRTVTNAHANNANIVESGNSAEASTVALTQINVQITGTILAGGLPLANVLMAGLPGTVVTNASGVYNASVAAGSSPTVTPTLEGYSFVPGSRAYPTVTEDQIAQDYSAFTIDTFTLTYLAGAGGTISGTTPQAVAYGGNGTEVTAVPNAGYHFVSWSDGVTTASRTDTNVIADITVTANFALGDFPYDGPWTGTNSEGRSVSLTVSGGGTAWSLFGYAIQFFCPAIGGTVSTTITQSGPGAITNGTFSYSSGTLAFAGTFGSPTTASGTYALTGYPVIHGLPGPPFVHTDYITYSGTWTATFGGTIPTVTVTSPNGGESWQAGSTHDFTWTQTGLSGTVTIDLYKGGVWMKTLGTADATAETCQWIIDASETVGTDYRVLVWQGSVSDESDGDFEIAAAIRKDDLVGTWDGQGVYYRDSDTGAWVQMASPATMITTGDIDDDGTDDLIGIWPSQGGVWVKYYATGEWVNLSSTAVYITTGDMNGDGRVDLLGTWDGQGVYYRDSATGAWVLMSSPASMITCGDLDNDGTDDLIGIWAGQGGVWVKYSSSGLWEFIGSTPSYIGAGDMNGDGRDELLGSWTGQGVFYRNSETGAWVQMSSEATMITAGDLEGDGTDDLLGLWPTQGGIWVKYSSTGGWELLSSTAQYIAAGKMRPAAGSPEMTAAAALPLPMGGTEPGPEGMVGKIDESSKGPGGSRFVYLTEPNLVPNEKGSANLTRVPGPGEPGFMPEKQADLFPAIKEKGRAAISSKEKPNRKIK